MPRKKKIINDAYNEPFPTALRTLMQDNSTTQQELSSFLGISRQAIGYYCDGTSSPDFVNLVKIANYFNVSADYLLGISKDRQRTPAAADELGLSEKAIEGLKSLNGLSKSILDRIFEREVGRCYFDSTLFNIEFARHDIQKIMEYGIFTEKEDEAIAFARFQLKKQYTEYPTRIIDGRMCVEFDIFSACTDFEKLLKDYIRYDDFEKYMLELYHARLKQEDENTEEQLEGN